MLAENVASVHGFITDRVRPHGRRNYSLFLNFNHLQALTYLSVKMDLYSFLYKK